MDPASELPGRNGERIASKEYGEAVAQYLADVSGQLEAMARAANLELLAYLFSMARIEAEGNVLYGRPGPLSPPH
jgi:hypothetical protein